jgi:hypothetical protein
MKTKQKKTKYNTTRKIILPKIPSQIRCKCTSGEEAPF